MPARRNADACGDHPSGGPGRAWRIPGQDGRLQRLPYRRLWRVGGKLEKARWLTGSPLGSSDPWGTTYASNLRLRLQEMDEAQWLAPSAELRTRPLVPDYNVRAMSEEDRRALYRFIKSLGPGGQPAPA